MTGITAFDLDNETLRIEISYRGGKLFDDNISFDETSGIVRVDLENALPGRISRASGAQIQDDAKNFVEKITTNKTGERHTRIQIFLKDSPEKVDVSLEPANSSEKKDARVVVDVKKVYVEPDDFSPYGTVNRSGRHVIVIDPGHGGSDAGAIGPT